MNLHRYCWLLLCLCGTVSGAEWCAVESRIALVLPAGTPGQSRPVNAFLIGGLAAGLRIVDEASGRVLWSGGATGPTTQRFSGMTAGFTSSLVVVDTNGDAAHDRIYAGDVRGRLWRFDLDTSLPPSRWVTGGVFADLAVGVSGRGFLAAPDVTLISTDGAPPWLSIAIGTANTLPALSAGPVALVNHRFYILRDRAPFERWTQRQYDQWTPLTEDDLSLVEGHQRLPVARPAGAGFYVNLGTDQVLAPALTLNGNTLFAVARTRASFLPACPVVAAIPVSVTVSSISALDGNRQNVPGGLDLQLPGPDAANSGVTLAPDDGTTGGVVCALAAHTLPGCSLDTTLRRSFWRREDAD